MTSFNPEKRGEFHEQEPVPSSIRIEFFRHDDKEKPLPDAPKKPDELVRISEAGRQHATDAGKTKSPNPEVGVVYGSGRERTTETALRQMLANEEEITPDMTLEDMKAKIGEEVKVGRKDISSSLLNFNFDGSKGFHDAAFDHFLKSKDLLRWYVTESDNVVRAEKDSTSTSYSRLAGNVAELVDKYMKIYPRWKQITESDPDKYASYHNELQRFMGTHQSVSEAFLMKVLEKTKGAEAVTSFIDSLKDKNGFGSSEGFTVQILESEGEQQLIVKFRDEEWQTSPAVIDEIIDERDKLNESISANGE
jgi:hypothetical protein